MFNYLIMHSEAVLLRHALSIKMHLMPVFLLFSPGFICGLMKNS